MKKSSLKISNKRERNGVDSVSEDVIQSPWKVSAHKFKDSSETQEE